MPTILPVRPEAKSQFIVVIKVLMLIPDNSPLSRWITGNISPSVKANNLLSILKHDVKILSTALRKQRKLNSTLLSEHALA